jgi:predicted short-subunit dehydrogenase-like oxidoreductase (DUF2520 family)
VVRNSNNVTVNKFNKNLEFASGFILTNYMKTFQSIALIGTGNVGFHIGNQLLALGIPIECFYTRNPTHQLELCERWSTKNCTEISSIQSDFVIVCVNDDAVKSVIDQIPLNCNVVFTAGSVELSSIMRENCGVLYPLQSFNRSKKIDFSTVPFLIEGTSVEFTEKIVAFAQLLSPRVTVASSKERGLYHLAAVWINNFTNHMIYTAKNISDENHLNWDYLLPLLHETVAKISTLSPYDAQTGPAKRNDEKIIQKHLDLQDGMQQEIYLLISKSIQQTYKKDDKL